MLQIVFYWYPEKCDSTRDSTLNFHKRLETRFFEKPVTRDSTLVIFAKALDSTRDSRKVTPAQLWSFCITETSVCGNAFWEIPRLVPDFSVKIQSHFLRKLGRFLKFRKIESIKNINVNMLLAMAPCLDELCDSRPRLKIESKFSKNISINGNFSSRAGDVRVK